MNHLPSILLLLLITLIPLDMASQENILYRYHYLHPVILNPAIAGSEFFPVANLTYHKQWIGIHQSPQTMLASTSLRIGNFDFYNPRKMINTSNLRTRERIGLGLCLFSDRNGPALQRGINLAYSYHLILEQSRISLGMGWNLEQHTLDGTIFDPTFPGDPILHNDLESHLQHNASAGAYYYSAGLSAGVAVHHLIPFENKFHPGSVIKPDLIVHGGYLFTSLGRPRLEISLDGRYLDFNQFEYDVHFRAYMQEFHWLAVSVRSYKALAFHLGIRISIVHLAYSYEANLSNMIRYNLGSHAIHLGMNLGMRRIKGF